MKPEKFKKFFRARYCDDFLECLLRMKGTVQTVQSTVRLNLEKYKEIERVELTEEEEAEFLKEFDEKIVELSERPYERGKAADPEVHGLEDRNCARLPRTDR